MQVISMTIGKIRKEQINGQEIIVKKSSFDEIRKIEEARKLFKHHCIKLDGKDFTFHLPKIYDYRENEIYMELLTGDNLEINLRTPQNRNQAVKVTNLLFQYLYDNNIYWGDFAPRNVMINVDKQTINLCDFERGIQTNITGKEFLQNYAYEEYAAFLFPRERTFSEKLNDIFTVDREHQITIDDIRSNRIKSIIKEMNIPENSLTNQTSANINKMIIIAETPYNVNGQNIFPIIELENIKDNSYELFAKKVCNIVKTKGLDNGYSRRL